MARLVRMMPGTGFLGKILSMVVSLWLPTSLGLCENFDVGSLGWYDFITFSFLSEANW